MNNILDTLSNPSMLHAALVHFPVALASLGFLLVLLLCYFNDKMNYRWLAIMVYLMCFVSGWVAENTGENAMDMVSNRLSNEIWNLINEHQVMGERVYIMSAVTLLFLIISLIEHDAVRKIMTLFSLAASLSTFLLVSFTAHYGGVLVYEHGVGTPMSHVGYEGMQGTPETPGDAIPISDINMDEARLLSFKKDIWPIFEDRCLSCHESPDPDGEYAMDDYTAIMTEGPKGGPSVVPGKPDESSIVHYIRGLMKPQMPKKKEPLSEHQVHMIRMWIAAGAVDDSVATEIVAPTPVEAPAFDPFGGSDTTSLPAPLPVPSPTPETTPVTTPEATPAPVAEPTPAPAPAATFDPFGNENNESAEPQVEKKEEIFDPFGGGDIQQEEQVEETPPVTEKVPEPKKSAPIKPKRNPLFDPFST